MTNLLLRKKGTIWGWVGFGGLLWTRWEQGIGFSKIWPGFDQHGMLVKTWPLLRNRLGKKVTPRFFGLARFGPTSPVGQNLATSQKTLGKRGTRMFFWLARF